MAPQGDFTVSDNYNVNYYGSMTLAAGKTPLQQPTDVGKPGSEAAEQAVADNAKRTITLDDGSSWNYAVFGSHTSDPLPWLTKNNPVRIGSAVTFSEPVILDYRFDLWNFQPRQQVTDDGSAVATFSDTRTENEHPAPVGGDISMATFNVENYFPMTGAKYEAKGLGTCTYYEDRQGNKITVDECTGTDGSDGPRGAANEVNLQRQQDKIVTGINRLGASIVSLEEIGNSAKFGEDRDTALADLVDALNDSAGSKKWAYVPSPDKSDMPPLDQQDVIRTALIYQPANVRPVGPAHVLTGDSADGQPFAIARLPFAQEFKGAGAADSSGFLVVANHLKSKGTFFPPTRSCDEENTDPAYDQGAFNCTRVDEAKDMAQFASNVAEKAGTRSSCWATSTPTPTRTRCRRCTPTATPTWAASTTRPRPLTPTTGWRARWTTYSPTRRPWAW
jgi:predicted extracellular nuclease